MLEAIEVELFDAVGNRSRCTASYQPKRVVADLVATKVHRSLPWYCSVPNRDSGWSTRNCVGQEIVAVTVIHASRNCRGHNAGGDARRRNRDSIPSRRA